MPRRLQLRFLSLSAFKREFDTNISHGGAFVETDLDLELQETIEVELDLAFCGHLLVLEAQVVTRVPAGVHASGAQTGYAVQFTESAHMLRLLLSGMSGVEPPPAPKPWTSPERAAEPGQERFSTELLATLESSGRRQSVLVVNMSRSGALLELEGGPIAVDAEIGLVFRDPTANENFRVDACVVRQDSGSDGRSRIGVVFQFDGSDATQTAQCLERLLSSSRAQKLGRIVGDLAALGLPSLLQMFSSGAEHGTLKLTRGAREACVLFERGALRHVRIGNVGGLKALCRLLDWSDGRFEYRPTLAQGAPDDIGVPIDFALLEATQHWDELQRIDLSAFPAASTVRRVAGAEPDEELDKTAQELLERCTESSAVAQLVDALSCYDDEIYSSLATLADRGLIEIG